MKASGVRHDVQREADVCEAEVAPGDAAGELQQRDEADRRREQAARDRRPARENRRPQREREVQNNPAAHAVEHAPDQRQAQHRAEKIERREIEDPVLAVADFRFQKRHGENIHRARGEDKQEVENREPHEGRMRDDAPPRDARAGFLQRLAMGHVGNPADEKQRRAARARAYQKNRGELPRTRFFLQHNRRGERRGERAGVEKNLVAREKPPAHPGGNQVGEPRQPRADSASAHEMKNKERTQQHRDFSERA